MVLVFFVRTTSLKVAGFPEQESWFRWLEPAPQELPFHRPEPRLAPLFHPWWEAWRPALLEREPRAEPST